MFLEISVLESIVNICEGLIIAIITATVGYFFTKKYFSQIAFAKKMKNYGFLSSVTTNDIKDREYRRIFDEASLIRIIYVSGRGFFEDPEHIRGIKRALDRGAEVRILVARKDNVFLRDIVDLEVNSGIRKAGTNIDSETDEVHSKLSQILKDMPGSRLQVKYYSSEYRLPMIIAEFKDKKQDYALSWLYITLPPYKSQTKFLLRGQEDFDSDDIGEGNLVLMMIKHFDSVWESAKFWEESAPIYWDERYKEAKKNRVSSDQVKRILIQVSAQHPLRCGCLPNAEFTARLDFAIGLYNKYKEEGKQVKLYIPGSRHMDKGIEDKISLSSAGKGYLTEKGIPASDIIADEANDRFKGSLGVYNSADECYVSSQLYKNGEFDRVCCVCSPIQTLKNTLFFCENGILPDVYGIPCDDQFHSPYYEASHVLPEILHYDHSWQGSDSENAKLSRKERMPSE